MNMGSQPSGPPINPFPPKDPPPQPAVIKVPSSTNPVVAWLKDHNFSSHTIAALLVGTAGAIVGNQQVRDLVASAFSKHPDVMPVIMLLAGAVLNYKRSTTTVGAATQ